MMASMVLIKLSLVLFHKLLYLCEVGINLLIHHLRKPQVGFFKVQHIANSLRDYQDHKTLSETVDN